MPPGFWECGDHDKQAEMIKKNMRAILQLFGIKVLVYPDRVEIKGTIPSQVLYQGENPEPETGLVLPSPSPLKEGEKFIFIQMESGIHLQAMVKEISLVCFRVTLKHEQL